MNHNKYIIGFSFIIIGIFIIFSNIYYCDFPADENYQALCVKDYSNSPLALTTFMFAHFWTKIIGFSIFHLRILARLCIIISITLSSIFLWEKTNNFILTATAFLISSFISNLSCFGIFNWDTGTYPIEAITTLATLYYIKRPNYFKTILLGICCGIMLMSRVTTILFILCLIPLVYYSHKLNDTPNKIKLTIIDCLIGIVSCLFSISIIALISNGSIEAYIYSFNSKNIISGHGINNLNTFIWRFKTIFPFVCVSWIPILFNYIFAHKISTNGITIKKYIVYILASIMLGWSILRIYAINSGYDCPIFGLSLPLVLILSLFPFKENTYNKISVSQSKQLKLQSIVILIMVFNMGFGSDAAYERWNSVFLFPIALGINWNFFKSTEKAICKTWLNITLCMLAVMLCYKQYAISKDYTWPNKEVSSRGKIPMTIHMNECWKKITPIIDSLDQANASYTFWGLYRYSFSLEYETKPYYSIQPFHYSNDNIIRYITNPEKLDYVILTFYPDIKNVDTTYNALLKNGFEIDRANNSYVLMKNKNHE